jgi:hypothetical protein
MKKFATGILAALSALALGSAAIAADHEPVTEVDETMVTDAEDVDGHDDEVSEDLVDEDGTNFGQTRSAWVKEARLSGEKPGPAWCTPGHPTGGPAHVDCPEPGDESVTEDDDESVTEDDDESVTEDDDDDVAEEDEEAVVTGAAASGEGNANQGEAQRNQGEAQRNQGGNGRG